MVCGTLINFLGFGGGGGYEVDFRREESHIAGLDLKIQFHLIVGEATVCLFVCLWTREKAALTGGVVT